MNTNIPLHIATLKYKISTLENEYNSIMNQDILFQLGHSVEEDNGKDPQVLDGFTAVDLYICTNLSNGKFYTKEAKSEYDIFECKTATSEHSEPIRKLIESNNNMMDKLVDFILKNRKTILSNIAYHWFPYPNEPDYDMADDGVNTGATSPTVRVDIIYLYLTAFIKTKLLP